MPPRVVVLTEHLRLADALDITIVATLIYIVLVWLRDRASRALAMAIAHMSEQLIGALVILPGRQSLDRHIRGGVAVDAEISGPLLLSVFHPMSLGRDGARILHHQPARQLAQRFQAPEPAQSLWMINLRKPSRNMVSVDDPRSAAVLHFLIHLQADRSRATATELLNAALG